MIRRIAAIALLCLPAGSSAQPDFSKVEIKTQTLGTGVAVLFGEGGNIGVSYGADGTVLVDDQYAPLTDRIVAAAKALDPKPVRFIVNTHWHLDHSGGNENHGRAGAVIIAHDNVRTRMSTEQFMAGLNKKIPASPPAALPVVTFGDGVTLHLNGDTVRVVHVDNAHTDGDALVKWEKANVLHMGDVFVRYGLPFIDLSSGGSIDGLIKGVDTALALSDDRTRVIPGHGEVATRADMAEFRAMLIAIRDKVAAGIGAGRTLAQIKASGPAKGYRFLDFVNPDAFTETVYQSLKSAPHDHGDGAHRH